MSPPDLNSSPEELLEHANRVDLSNSNRANLQEALMILQFQLLVQQAKTARAQLWTTVGTFMLFLATIALVFVTAA
jgi:hypothetical protein